MVTSGGLQVTTSLDYSIQQKAEDILKSEIEGLTSYHVGKRWRYCDQSQNR